MRLLFLALLTLAIAAGPSPAAAPADCTGTGAVNTEPDPSKPPIWALTCSGDCPGATQCKDRNGSDAQGAFKFCGCDNTDTDACCTVVLRPLGTDGAMIPKKYGSCPPCPAQGFCILANVGGEMQPGCMVITPREPEPK